MAPEQSRELEYILGHISVGVGIINYADLRILFVNAYLTALLDQLGCSQEAIGLLLDEAVPAELLKIAQPILHEVCSTGKSRTFSAVPYEGFLAARGRTYWRVCLERYSSGVAEQAVLITIEDVTEQARSRLYSNAIHHISSAIVGPFALPQVLDRILQAVQEMVGSTRCAVLLLDHSVSGVDQHNPDAREQSPTVISPAVTIAAQKGIHPRSHNWHPELSEQLLLGHVARDQQTLIISNSGSYPDLDFPFIDEEGVPLRPGSALCVPIFEPTAEHHSRGNGTIKGKIGESSHSATVLGAIEVYHQGARSFPSEEVELLEEFAQQAGLAIQNARFFLQINRLAQDASRSARQQKNVMQAIPDGVIIYDARWRVIDANYAMRNLLGWPEDIIGLPITEAFALSAAKFPGEDFSSNQIELLDRRALERYVDECKLVGADGQDYTIRRSYASIHDELGNFFASVVIYHDVTEQAAARERIEAEVVKRTMELAQRNEALQLAKAAQELASARLQLLLERLPSGVILVSAIEGRISVINHQAVQLLQRIGAPFEPHDDLLETGENALNTNVEDLFRTIVAYTPSGSPVPYKELPLALALHKGEASEAELQLKQQDGQALFLLVSAAPLRSNDGTISSAILVLHEITRLKALERAREDFFTSMAHELKTPLANIRAHLSALQSKDLQWSSEEQQTFLEIADEQVERLVRMVNQFLDASRVEAGALRLDLEAIILPEMVEDLQERLEAFISSTDCKLEITLPPHLPAVLADYELIMSVLTNLLSNAFRYTSRGDTVCLEVEPVYDDDHQQSVGVEICVIDHGPGIAWEQQAKLFTRFSTFAAQSRPAVDRPGQPTVARRSDSSRWSSSTGLGLYISRGIVEAHGSTLRLKSAPGQGACFSFFLAVRPYISSE